MDGLVKLSHRLAQVDGRCATEVVTTPGTIMVRPEFSLIKGCHGLIAGSASISQPSRPGEPAQTLAETVAGRIREQVISGMLTPGGHLSEQALSEEMQVSRNTLREVFRIPTKEGLLRYEANRGVCVSTPSMSTIIDTYRVRRLRRPIPVIQALNACAPLSRGPGLARRRQRRHRLPRADLAGIAADLRPLQHPEFLHDPFID